MAGEMNHLARYIVFKRMEAIRARLLLGMALLKGRVSNSQEGNQSVQLIMHPVIDGSRF